MNAPDLIRLASKRRATSKAAALKLTATQMPVIVTRDDGTEFSTKLRSLPWQLGHGVCVCLVEGVAGGYDCARVRPA